MLNILLFLVAVGFISWQCAVFFNDVWLRDAQHKRLRQKFEDWWLTVEDLDKLKLALACTVSLNRLLFGDNLGWLRDSKVFPDASVTFNP